MDANEHKYYNYFYLCLSVVSAFLFQLKARDLTG
jgi:hypothetical protein